jgi:hypothetical protein
LALALKHVKGDLLWEGIKADMLELRSEAKVLSAMIGVLLGMVGIEQQQQQQQQQQGNKGLMHKYAKIKADLLLELHPGTADFLQV